jgi:hypothetical protein
MDRKKGAQGAERPLDDEKEPIDAPAIPSSDDRNFDNAHNLSRELH